VVAKVCIHMNWKRVSRQLRILELLSICKTQLPTQKKTFHYQSFFHKRDPEHDILLDDDDDNDNDNDVYGYGNGKRSDENHETEQLWVGKEKSLLCNGTRVGFLLFKLLFSSTVSLRFRSLGPTKKFVSAKHKKERENKRENLCDENHMWRKFGPKFWLFINPFAIESFSNNMVQAFRMRTTLKKGVNFRIKKQEFLHSLFDWSAKLTLLSHSDKYVAESLRFQHRHNGWNSLHLLSGGSKSTRLLVQLGDPLGLGSLVVFDALWFCWYLFFEFYFPFVFGIHPSWLIVLFLRTVLIPILQFGYSLWVAFCFVGFGI